MLKPTRYFALFGTLAIAAVLSSTPAQAWQKQKRQVQGCYKQVHTAPVYKNVRRKVQISPAHVSYSWSPAVYKTKSVKVLVSHGRKVAHTQPAVYSTVHKKVMVQPARTGWEVKYKHGQPIHCKVHYPAVFKHVKKRVLVQHARTTYSHTPAQYRWVKKRVMVRPAQKIAHRTRAKYGYVTERVQVHGGHAKWVRVKGCW